MEETQDLSTPAPISTELSESSLSEGRLDGFVTVLKVIVVIMIVIFLFITLGAIIFTSYSDFGMLGAIVLPIREFCYELIGNAAATGLAIITSIILIGFTAMMCDQ